MPAATHVPAAGGPPRHAGRVPTLHPPVHSPVLPSIRSRPTQGYCDVPDDVYSIISRAFYGMHAHWLRHNPLGAPYTTAPPPPRWAEQVRKVALYDSLAFFKRGTPIKWLTRLRRGTDVIPYGAGAHRTPA